MPQEQERYPLSNALDTTIRGLHLAARVVSWVTAANFIAGTAAFVGCGIAGNTAEMNASGMYMYITGAGSLALHWIATSPLSPIGYDAYNSAQRRIDS